MSLVYTGPNIAARDTLATVLDKAHEYPTRGAHVGSRAAEGPPIPAAWDGNGPVPLGWSSYRAHRNDPEGVVWLPEPETGSKLARLTAQERALLTQARAEAIVRVPELEPGAAPKEARRL
jgi:hypothetical protein